MNATDDGKPRWAIERPPILCPRCQPAHNAPLFPADAEKLLLDGRTLALACAAGHRYAVQILPRP